MLQKPDFCSGAVRTSLRKQRGKRLEPLGSDRCIFGSRVDPGRGFQVRFFPPTITKPLMAFLMSSPLFKGQILQNTDTMLG